VVVVAAVDALVAIADCGAEGHSHDRIPQRLREGRGDSLRCSLLK
jgi:hypothetical protein